MIREYETHGRDQRCFINVLSFSHGALPVDIVIPGARPARDATSVGRGSWPENGRRLLLARGSTTILSARGPVMGQCISLPSHESERRCTDDAV